MTRRGYLSMGTNLPWGGISGSALLARALTAIEDAGLVVDQRSYVWRSPAWPPGSQQPDFHNAVLGVDVGQRDPEETYSILASIERAFGRERLERWGPRTMDLDIISIDGRVGRFGLLELPHPRMHERAFVLAPLAELAPDWRHPVLHASTSDLLTALGEHEAVLVGPLPLVG